MTITVKHKFVSTIPDSADTGLVRPTNWNDDHDLSGLGTMAEQDADAVAITGGTIDGTDIGQTDPAAGKFTGVESTGDVDAEGNVSAQGDVAADGKVTGGTGVEATTGDVTAPDGKVTAKDDIETTDGQFVGDGGGLTGEAPNLTAGKAKTVEGLVYNDTANDIPAGSVVYLKPSATHISVDLAEATDYDKSQVFAITLDLILKNGGSGYVCAYGYLEGFDTSSYSYGQLLYLDPANPGELTDLQPQSPNYIVTVANVWEVGAAGTLFVNPNNASIDDNFFIGLLKIAHGGTNSEATPTQGGVAYGDGTKYVFTNVGTTGQLLQSTGLTAPIWVDPSSAAVTRFSAGTTGFTPDTLTGGDVTLAGTLKTTNGGTGLSTYTGGDMVYWESGTAFTKLPIGSANQMLISTGTAPDWDDVSNQAVTGISGGTTGLTATNGSGGSKGAVTLDGALTPAHGGTGSTSTPTSGGVAYGNPTGGTGGTPALSTTPAGTPGQILQSNGAGAPSWVNSSSITALTIVNDTTTNSLFYPTFTDATGGTVSQLDVSSPKYTYNPLLGEIQSTDYKGDFVDYRTSPTATVTGAVGRTWWDSTGTLNIGMGGGNITQQVGEELFVYGKASAAITDSPLQIVYHTGTVGASGVITFAPTIAGITDENAIIGVATENIANNGFGRVTAFGVVHNITTNGAAFGETWADDDVIWYNPVTGNPTKVKPSAPNIKFQIGNVIKAGAGGSGSFQVNLVQGTALGGTDSNVQITSVANKDLLVYDSALGYWKNAQPSTIGVSSFSAGTTGFTPSTASTGAVTLSGTLGTANGGTNNTATPTAGTVATGDGTKITYTAAGTSGQILNSNGSGTPTWIDTSSITAGKATNLAGGSAGVVPYQSATDTTAFTSVGTAGQVLKSNGTSAPTWVNPSSLNASISITDDTTTNSTFYPTFTSATSGTITGENVSSTKFSYNPSAGSITTYGDAFFNGMRVGHGAANITSNSVVGADSLSVATTGANNTAMGYQSLKNVTTGSNLTAFGYQAGFSATTAEEFNVFGYLAGYSNTTGHGLTAVGYAAGYANTTGYYNSYIGSHTGQNNVGEYNTVVGGLSFYSTTAANYNTLVGAYVAAFNTIGSSNTALGYHSLYVSTGSGNVALGAYAGNYETGSNAFYVNNQDRTNTAGDKASSLMYGTFNATASSQTLQINAATTVSYQLRINSTLSLNGSTGTSGYVLTSNGASAPTWSALPATGVTISDDTTTNSNLYPLFTTATSGSVTTQYVSSTKYKYNPSLGTLSAPQVAATNGLMVNSNTVSASYSIPSGSSAMSAGPMTVASGQTVTVASGSRWVVL